MKKIIFFQVVMICLCGSAQQTKKSSQSAKPQIKKEVPDQSVTENTSGFRSPLVSIPYKGVVTAPSPAQAKDNLLWYKGKKVNDSLLITTDAKLVLYSKSRNMVVVQPPTKTDPSLKILKRIEAIEEDKKKLVEATAGKPNNFFLYPHIVAAFKEFDEQNKYYAEALKNVIPLPEKINTAFAKSYTTGGYASLIPKIIYGVPSAIKQVYDEIIQKKKNYPSLDFPPPPTENFSTCYQCDGIAKNQYAINKFKWNKEFSQYEADLVERSQSVFKTIELLSLNSDPEAMQIKADLDKVIEFSFARMKNKVDLLITKYGKDFTRLPTIIATALSIERQKQLLDASENDTYSETMLKLISLFNGFDKYLQQQMEERNYDVAFNMAFIIGIERQRQLLGAVEENNIPALIEKINAFNRFKMEMEVDFAISCDDNGDATCPFLSASGSLTTKRDFYVSFTPYKCGGYQIYLTHILYNPETEALNRELHYTSSVEEVNKYELELIASDGNEKTVYADDDGNRKIKTESFTGVKVLSHLPLTRIYFCKDKKDTLYVLGFYNKYLETSDKRHYTKSISEYMNYLVANTSEEELEAHMPKVVAKSEEYEKRMKNYEVEPTGFEKADKMQNQFNIVNLYQQNAETIINYLTKDAAIFFNAENGEQEIMNAATEVSGKTIENMKVNKGIVKIKIVHDPLPYKTTLKK